MAVSAPQYARRKSAVIVCRVFRSLLVIEGFKCFTCTLYVLLNETSIHVAVVRVTLSVCLLSACACNCCTFTDLVYSFFLG